jgi:signal transduction histidine kinase
MRSSNSDALSNASVRYRTEHDLVPAPPLIMLHEFLTQNRSALLEECRAKARERDPVRAPATRMSDGIPTFLDQLIRTLAIEQTATPQRSRLVSGPSGGGPAPSEIAESASIHGRDLSRRGCTVDQVVHEYGDLCQAIGDLAIAHDATISVDEFRTLNRCLDNGIADAVTEFAADRLALVRLSVSGAQNERLGVLAHELRNHLHTATLAIMALRAGKVGLTGATGAVLDRSLIGMRGLIDRSLADVRALSGVHPDMHLISLADFVADVGISAGLEARTRRCILKIDEVDPTLAVEADREMLFSAVGNLLQNAFKFTRPGTEVSLAVSTTQDWIRIDVRDHCGGLQIAHPEDLFLTFKQGTEDRSGLGLGLAIARRGIESMGGTLVVRNEPGSGCVFTIGLPRRELPDPA